MGKTSPKQGSPDAGEDIAKWPVERCFEELEKIVASLESQSTSLEDSIALFERGMKLSTRCSGELTRIEKKIQLIVENSKGEIQLKDFEAEGTPEK